MCIRDREVSTLVKKRERFVEEYLIDLNATQAAIRAGYSPKTAYSIGHELMKIPEVRARIYKAMAERSKRTGINADRVLRELGKIASVSYTHLDVYKRQGRGAATAAPGILLGSSPAAATRGQSAGRPY